MSIQLDLSSRPLYLYRVSFALGDLQHFKLLPLSFLLCVLIKRCMMGSYLRVLPCKTLKTFFTEGLKTKHSIGDCGVTLLVLILRFSQ
jgi:hypothetical protein